MSRMRKQTAGKGRSDFASGTPVRTWTWPPRTSEPALEGANDTSGARRLAALYTQIFPEFGAFLGGS